MSGKLLRSAAVFSSMTFLSRLSGLVRDQVYANVFGAGGMMDAFFVAFRIPNFMRRLSAEGSFSMAFVPVLAEYKATRSADEVKALVDRVAGTLTAALLVLTAIVILLAPHLGQTRLIVLAIGVAAIVLLLIGERALPGRPVALALVAGFIVVATLLELPESGVPVTGHIEAGLPSLQGPALQLRDVEGILPLAAGCLLLAYVESVSAARTFANKHGYALDPRQEFLGLGAANLGAALGHGYPVAGGLSQSAVNEKAGAKTPLSLVVASAAAFLLSEFADFMVYTPLARRKLVLAVLASSAVGLVVDSIVFLWLAFGSIEFLFGQIVGKLWMVVLALPFVFWIRRRDERLGLKPA